MDKIIGTTFRKEDQEVGLQYILGVSDFIGIYFGAHWAPPCRSFTQTLKEFYEKVNATERRFEVIFVSNDGNDAAFERNFAEMPWCSVPLSDNERSQNLRQ